MRTEIGKNVACDRAKLLDFHSKIPKFRKALWYNFPRVEQKTFNL
jgi:hypothetical protein